MVENYWHSSYIAPIFVIFAVCQNYHFVAYRFVEPVFKQLQLEENSGLL